MTDNPSSSAPSKGPMKGEDPIASEAAAALCAFCEGGNRSLPVERHGVTAYVHYATAGEEIVCHASAVKVLEDALAQALARVQEVELSCISHFQRDHLEGDGPEIDRWKRKLASQEAHVRNHHLEACESCIATESRAIGAEQELAEAKREARSWNLACHDALRGDSRLAMELAESKLLEATEREKVLREALETIVGIRCGIPGHSVAVGCGAAVTATMALTRVPLRPTTSEVDADVKVEGYRSGPAPQEQPNSMTPEMLKRAARAEKFLLPLPEEPDGGSDPDYGLLAGHRQPEEENLSLQPCEVCRWNIWWDSIRPVLCATCKRGKDK